MNSAEKEKYRGQCYEHPTNHTSSVTSFYVGYRRTYHRRAVFLPRKRMNMEAPYMMQLQVR